MVVQLQGCGLGTKCDYLGLHYSGNFRFSLYCFKLAQDLPRNARLGAHGNCPSGLDSIRLYGWFLVSDLWWLILLAIVVIFTTYWNNRVKNDNF